jgi:hypothetical protein
LRLLVVHLPLALVYAADEPERLWVARARYVFDLADDFERAVEARVDGEVGVFVGAERGLLMYFEAERGVLVDGRVLARARKDSARVAELLRLLQPLGEFQERVRRPVRAAQNLPGLVD